MSGSLFEASSTESQPRYDVLGRPNGQLHDFPFEMRWEVTRRHPYYQIFWSEALRHRRNERSENEPQRLLRFAAVLMLGSIGVTGEPVDPSTPFEQLVGNDVDPGFLTSSVQPMTLRSLVVLLVNGLPAEDRLAIGNLLAASAAASSGTESQRGNRVQETLGQLMQLSSPALDSIPEVPLFYIHLAASQRSIGRDVLEQARHWKLRRKIPERRIHTAKLNKYLEVWDRREGWAVGGYALSRERRFRDVAVDLRRSPATVSNQYRAAFEMITGYPFSPALWWRLFGPLKYSSLIGNPAEIVSAPMRHRMNAAAARTRTRSHTSASPERRRRAGDVDINAASDAQSRADFFMDLDDLIDRGQSDQQIADHLGTDAKVIGDIRSRIEEQKALK